MTPGDLRNELENLLTLLRDAELTLVVAAVGEEHSRQAVRITWVSSASHGPLFRMSGPTISEYQAWLQHGAYSAVLFDGSLLQITYDFDARQNLVGHRLAYVPCPFDMDPDFVQSEPLFDLVGQYASDPTATRLRSTIRFDYDVAAAKEGHPASHLTMVSSHCRIACIAPVCIGRFIRFVFCNFYPEQWKVHSFIREWATPHMGAPVITPLEQRDLHFSWRS